MLSSKLKKKYGYDTPIFAEEILENFNNYTKAYVYRLLDKELELNKIKKYSQGVYYIPKKTVLGDSTITARDVAFKKYIYNCNSKTVNGIYCGLSLANEFNLTTQVPNKIFIVTNFETTRSREIDINGMKYVLKKSRTKIDKDNVYTYKLLTLFTENDIKDFTDDTYEYIYNYIKKYKIQSNDIYQMLNYFPAKTSKRLIQFNLILNSKLKKHK